MSHYLLNSSSPRVALPRRAEAEDEDGAVAMYWPLGTPRLYATSSSRAPAFKLVLSNDGLSSASQSSLTTNSGPSYSHSQSANYDHADLLPPPTPITPITPITPAVQSVEHDDYSSNFPLPESPSGDENSIPLKDPLLALRVSRNGNLFAVITSTSITVWQTKVGFLVDI